MMGQQPPSNPFASAAGAPGLPPGGKMPTPKEAKGAGNSPLLDGLMSQLGGQDQDPLAGVGTGDPQMGIEQLLQLLALGQLGAGGVADDTGMGAGSPGGSAVPQLPTRQGMAVGPFGGGGAY